MVIRKAILTGGGRATRLRPITTTINKHLIPLANKPMIFHAIDKAVEAGIEEIFINTNPGETQLQQIIGDGAHWGIKITYFEQTGGPLGIAHVVKCAEKFIGKDPFMFYLSDNIILGSLKPIFKKFTDEKLDCQLAFATVPDPERFGVPVFSQSGELIDVVEKPAKAPNNFAQTGIYLYGPNIFYKAFDHIKKSPRGEYEISDIHSYLLKNNFKVGWEEVSGWWKDTGKPEDLIITSALLLDELAHDQKNFKISGSVDPEAILTGSVQIGIGASVGKGVKLLGPVIIGENCVLENCTVGPYATVGSGSSIKQATITQSILFSNCQIDSRTSISQSIIGEQVKITTKDTPAQRFILGDQTVIEL